MVFSMQAAGLVAGPLVSLGLLRMGLNPELAWRVMLGLGAIPALAVIWLRRRLPESPRFLARVKGDTTTAVREFRRYAGNELGVVNSRSAPRVRARLRDYRGILLGTAGTWFLFDYAYYGNSISTPLIMKLVAPHASLIAGTAWTLAVFSVAALPGYILAFSKMDQIGHRRLQWIGFAVMGACFAALGLIPGITRTIAPFLLLYGLSYFFAEFGPNTTTFVLASELFPVNLRATGHGLSAGIAKMGAFIGVFLFPLAQARLGLAGTLLVSAGFAGVGALLTLLLPEPAGKSLEEASGEETVPPPTLRQAHG